MPYFDPGVWASTGVGGFELCKLLYDEFYPRHVASRKRKSQYDELFWFLPNECKAYVGRNHPGARGRIHPDELVAAKGTLVPVLGFWQGRKSLRLLRKAKVIDWTHNVCFSAGPNSSTHVKKVMNHFVKRKELPLYFAKKPGLISKWKVRGIDFKDPTWAIKDVQEKCNWTPDFRNDGKLRTDFLLLSVLPNINPSATKDSVVGIFTGCHGPGHKAVELLMRDSKLLDNMISERRSTRYYQSLFEVTGIEHGENSKAHEIRHLKTLPIRKIKSRA
jgi:hypothetical protein